MTTYVVAQLRNVSFGQPIVDYLGRIDATLAPFGGRFLVHGAKVDVLEGQWPGDLVILEFPDRRSASEWYRSAAYQEILPLRTEHSDADVVLVDGVAQGYRATDLLTRLGRAQ